MSRRNIILIAAPFVAVVVVVPLLKMLDASQGVFLAFEAVLAVVCGGALGAFADPVPELPWKSTRAKAALMAIRRRRRS